MKCNDYWKEDIISGKGDRRRAAAWDSLRYPYVIRNPFCPPLWIAGVSIYERYMWSGRGSGGNSYAGSIKPQHILDAVTKTV